MSHKPLPTLAQLTPEQQTVAQLFGEGMAVLAGAGAGKTTTLVVKCAELMRRSPDAKIAAVSFTEKSANDIREKLTRQLMEFKPENPLAGHWVTTIHGLCRMILHEFPEEAGLPGALEMLNERQAYWEWSESVRSLWLKRREGEDSELEKDIETLSQFKAHDTIVGAISEFRKIWRFYPQFAEKLADSAPLDPNAQAIRRLTREALYRYTERKLRLGGLDFEDLELRALHALQNPSVHRVLRARFDLFLVDEFQDTNPIQAQIVEWVAREDFSNLCVIGDPKQSIYRFRDADVGVFQKFCARMPRSLVLSKNFRSHPEVLKEINALCGCVFSGDDGENSIAYVPLVAGKVLEFDAPENSPNPHVAIWQAPDHASFADWIKNLVARGEKLEDVVLLMRQLRAKGAKWLQALSRAGIPVAIGGSGRFWEDCRSLELVSFLRAWFTVGEKQPWIEILRSPWVGVSDAQIDQWMGSKLDLREQFLNSEHPLAKWLKPLSSRPVRAGELLLHLLEFEFLSEEMRGPVLSLWHQVEEFSLKGLSPLEILAELARAITERHGEGEIPPPKSAGQLRVMTVHASKGLEFPHVILVDFDGSPKRANARDFYLQGEEGVYFLPLDEEGAKDKESSISKAWIERDQRAEVEESKRVFYVALTRAMRQLSFVVLDLPEKKTSAGSKAAKAKPVEDVSPFSVDHWRRWLLEGSKGRLVTLSDPAQVSVVRDAENAAEKSVLPENSVAEHFLSSPAKGPHDSHRQRARYGVSELVKLAQCERCYAEEFAGYANEIFDDTEEDASAVQARGLAIFDSDLKSGAQVQRMSAAEFGTQIHRVLELAAGSQSDDSLAKERIDTDFENLGKIQARSGFQIDLDALRKWVDKDLRHPGAEREIWVELPFEFHCGAVIVGKVDRLEIEKNRVKIVDFKVTTRLKSVDDLIATYELQLSIYALAVRRLLGEHAAQISIEREIVQISREGVRAVPLPSLSQETEAWKRLEEKIEAIVRQSEQILNHPQLASSNGSGVRCAKCRDKEASQK